MSLIREYIKRINLFAFFDAKNAIPDHGIKQQISGPLYITQFCDGETTMNILYST
jgi:hypothetical protein